MSERKFKYRKKPIVVEAYQLLHAEVIETLEGAMQGLPGDYIITGVEGEQYPWKASIFEAIYDPVTDESPPSTVHEIVKQHLEAHKYDGLCGDECGCQLDDLMPCSGESMSEQVPGCEPAYKVECRDSKNCDSTAEFGFCEAHMSTTRPEAPSDGPDGATLLVAPEVEQSGAEKSAASDGPVRAQGEVK